MDKEKVMSALKELKKSPKKRNFNQSIDLIINLKDFDLKRNPLNLLINVPYKIKDKKIAGFLEKKSEKIDSITKNEFDKFKDKKKLKNLIKKYDFFISNAKLMPAVATTFGRILGPAGKMPSPQMGVLKEESDSAIEELKKKIDTVIKIRAKEPSLKLVIGKQEMKDEEISKNILAVYSDVVKALPRGKDNLKNIMIKFTMDQPVKIEI